MILSRSTDNKIDVYLDTNEFLRILDHKGIPIDVFHKDFITKYGLGLGYSGFWNLINNRNTWKLVYAWALIDHLGVDLDSLFVVGEPQKKSSKKSENLAKG